MTEDERLWELIKELQKLTEIAITAHESIVMDTKKDRAAHASICANLRINYRLIDYALKEVRLGGHQADQPGQAEAADQQRDQE